jgi:hypothetical protein
VGEIGLCLDLGTTLFVHDIVGEVFLYHFPEQNRKCENRSIVVGSNFE